MKKIVIFAIAYSIIFSCLVRADELSLAEKLKTLKLYYGAREKIAEDIAVTPADIKNRFFKKIIREIKELIKTSFDYVTVVTSFANLPLNVVELNILRTTFLSGAELVKFTKGASAQDVVKLLRLSVSEEHLHISVENRKMLINLTVNEVTTFDDFIVLLLSVVKKGRVEFIKENKNSILRLSEIDSFNVGKIFFFLMESGEADFAFNLLVEIVINYSNNGKMARRPYLFNNLFLLMAKQASIGTEDENLYYDLAIKIRSTRRLFIADRNRFLVMPETLMIYSQLLKRNDFTLRNIIFYLKLLPRIKFDYTKDFYLLSLLKACDKLIKENSGIDEEILVRYYNLLQSKFEKPIVERIKDGHLVSGDTIFFNYLETLLTMYNAERGNNEQLQSFLIKIFDSYNLKKMNKKDFYLEMLNITAFLKLVNAEMGEHFLLNHLVIFYNSDVMKSEKKVVKYYIEEVIKSNVSSGTFGEFLKRLKGKIELKMVLVESFKIGRGSKTEILASIYHDMLISYSAIGEEEDSVSVNQRQKLVDFFYEVEKLSGPWRRTNFASSEFNNMRIEAEIKLGGGQPCPRIITGVRIKELN